MIDASIDEDLQAIARALERDQPPAALRERVLAAAASRRAPRRRTSPWLPMLAFAAGILATWWLVPPVPETPQPGALAVVVPLPIVANGSEPTRDRCTTALGPVAVAVEAGCRLRLSSLGVVLDVREPARLALHERTVVLDEGAVSFDVAPVGDRPPIEVDVGAGIVRVIGTRFEIQNVGDVGHLDLIHGRVEFHGRDGAVRAVEPGTRWSWSRVPEPAPVVEPGRGPRVPARMQPSTGPSTEPSIEPSTGPASPVLDLEGLLDEVARKRMAGAYGQAEALLRKGLDRVGDDGSAEVLSFELGTVVELDDPPRACEHWRAHARRFARGSSARRTAAHLARLGCDSD